MRGIALLAAIAALAGAVHAADRPFLLQAGDKGQGEEEAIERRLEWFEEARELDEHPGARLQRARAVNDLRAQIARGIPALLATESWEPLGPDGMTMLNWDMGRVVGRVTALAVDPANESQIYLGAAAGGVWKTVDGGQNWVQLFDQIGTESIGSILIEAGNPDHVWVGTGEFYAGCADYFGMGLFYSIDGGQTFEARNGSGDMSMPLSFLTALAQSPADKNILLAGGQGHCSEGGSSSGGGIYRTADGGLTWSYVLTSTGVRDLIFDPADPAIVYAQARGKGIYKSIDAGQNWVRLENGIPFGTPATYGRLAMAPSNSHTLYALVGPANGASLKLFRTDDAGDTWVEVNSDACEGQCFYNITLDVHPTDPERLLVGTIRPAMSIDGGATLTILTSGWGSGQDVHQDTHIVRFSHTNGNRFWVGSDGGLWRTDNSGGVFKNLNANLEITQFYDIAIDPVDPDRIYGGAQDNSSSMRDGEQLWEVTEVTGDGFMNAVDPRNHDRVFQTSYPNGAPAIILSTQRGVPGTFDWVSQAGFDFSEPYPWVTPLVTGADSIFAASNRIYRSLIGDNAGAYSWTPMSDNLTGNATAAVSVLTTADDGAALRMVAGTSNGRIHTTPDALAEPPEWTEITGRYPGGNVSDVAIDVADPMRIFVTRSAFAAPQLLRSTGGEDWEDVGTGLPLLPANAVSIDPIDPQRIFVGTDIGVYESKDGGDTFTPLMTGLPLGMVVTDLEISGDPHVLVAGTYARGAWKIAFEAEITDRIFADGFE
ncbi:MAG: WD40/YVTN/BNR-like repeat-containing protein [Rhodanobacteraceae bacterium]